MRAPLALALLGCGCSPAGDIPASALASGARARTFEWDGSAGDRAQGCATYAGGVWVCGNTSSPDLAPRGVSGHRTDYGPRQGSQAWFARVDPSNGRLVAFTYFGVPGEDRAYTVHAGPHGITGAVWSQKRTTWVVRYDPDLARLSWRVALVSDSKRQTRNALDVDSEGTVYVSGEADGQAFVACVAPSGVRWERRVGAGYAQTGVRVVGEDLIAAGRVEGELWLGRFRRRDGEPVWERRLGPLESAFNDGLAVHGAGDGLVLAVCGTLERAGVVVLADGAGTLLRRIEITLDERGRRIDAADRQHRAFYEIGGLTYLPDGRLVATGTVESTVAPWFAIAPDGAIADEGILPGTARGREAVSAGGVVWVSGNTSKGTPGKPWQPRSATLTRLVLDGEAR